jgi:hypothetical protein
VRQFTSRGKARYRMLSELEQRIAMFTASAQLRYRSLTPFLCAALISLLMACTYTVHDTPTYDAVGVKCLYTLPTDDIRGNL